MSTNVKGRLTGKLVSWEKQSCCSLFFSLSICPFVYFFVTFCETPISVCPSPVRWQKGCILKWLLFEIFLLLIQPQWTCMLKPNLFVSLKTWSMQQFSSLERNILFHTVSQVFLRVLAICQNLPQVWWVCNICDVSVLPNWVSCLLSIWSFFRSRISLARSISQQNWNIYFVLRVGLAKLN